MLTLVSCDNSTGPVSGGPYFVAFHAAAPIDRNYSIDYVENQYATVRDSVLGVDVKAMRILAWGRCSCGQLTEQAYMLCDSMKRPVASQQDGGSLLFKRLGENGEQFLHGSFVVDSLADSSTGFIIMFHGSVKYDTGMVAVTGGRLYAPPAR